MQTADYFTPKQAEIISRVIYSMRMRGERRKWQSGGAYSVEEIAQEFAGMLDRHFTDTSNIEAEGGFVKQQFLVMCGFTQFEPVAIRIARPSKEVCSTCFHAKHEIDCREVNDVSFCECV